MMELEKILKGIDVVSLKGNERIEIDNITFDSRSVTKGSLFIAVRGSKNDGHDFIAGALNSGASAIICETLPAAPDKKVIWVKTTDSAKALGQAASNFFGNPSSSLRLVGVTGTNGKTTIATLLYKMFTGLGYKCGLFSTVCNYVINTELPATHTTPDPVQLNKLMAEMVEAGCDYAFMEVSSHSADQQRIAGLEFAGGIFTNLTHDHLDYHKTFDNYLTAKKKFFDLLPKNAFALVNADDKNGKVMLQNCKASHYTFSVRGAADFRCTLVEQSFEGMLLKMMGEEVWTRFVGDFNASNLLAVCAASELLGADRKKILTILSDLTPVAGRLEVIRSQGGITGIVDYAHTPDALVNVIGTLNKIREKNIQLITVVGAGGDRDKTKRPEMAVISAEGSTRVILTSDNPRTEDPEMILNDMEAGITPELKGKTLRICDRREAIKAAVMLANKGDVILVAGKGHETYQDIKGVKHHFDDREELKKAFLQK
jgi:UDP-N-acetylmuramoyl-L-alanyl-D-glutamate--2,6-diaminopimelate ligase